MPPTEHELRLRERLGRLRNLPLLGGAKLSGELERLQRQIARIGEEATDEDVWRKVELARHDERPYTLDYVERLLDDWFELHGDRALADDGAMIAGLGKLGLSLRTVEGHLNRTFGKLGVASRTEAVFHAFNHHLISLEGEAS